MKSSIKRLLELKGDAEFLPIDAHAVIEGGGEWRGYDYLITFTQNGNRCAYVANPDEISSDYLICHGGVTFESNHHPAKDLLDNHDWIYWIGFDAAHYLDLPCYEKLQKYFPDAYMTKYLIDRWRENDSRHIFTGIHRDYEYMESECKDLIDQIISRGKNNE